MVLGRGRKGMPTPVSNARACLAEEAAAALDVAVAAARRRYHAQTTSLHVVYALLLQSAGGAGSGSGGQSPSCSLLRDALSRTRSAACSPRMHLKVLERCFGMALDRLPSSSSSSSSGGQREGSEDGPPVSNSLMAAIKRSQANQRRNPESFHLYQQQQQQNAAAGVASTFSGVKVEMQHLILAILDDPIVSRVFNDAGFRSGDIKFAIIRPPPTILRFPHAAKCAPLFLCNFSAGDGFEAPISTRRIGFPFAPAAGQLSSDGGDDYCRRVGDILSRKGITRNPMLIGVGAAEAATDFTQAIQRQNWAILPLEIRGIELVSLEKVVAELRTGRCDLSSVDARLMELGKKAAMPRLVVNIGDLKEIVKGKTECDEHERRLVSELTRLLDVYQGRLWLMAWSATYETYMKFLSRHPLLDKDWNLQLLPITSVRSGMGSSVPRPRGMESFVPFGGLYSTACESKDLGSGVSPPASRCELCDDKYEEELSIFLKGQSASVYEKKKDTLPFWLQKANPTGLNNEYNAEQAKNAKTMELEKKWNEVCRKLHNCQTTKTDIYPEIPCTADTSSVSSKNRASSKITEESQTLGNSLSISLGTQTITMASQSISLPLVMESRKSDLLSKLQVRSSKSEQLRGVDLPYHQGDEHASPSSITSVAIDLVLGSLPETLSSDEKPAREAQKSHVEKMSRCLPSVDTAKRNVSDVPIASFSCSGIQEYQAKSVYPVHPIHSFSQISNGCASTCDKPPFLISGSTRQNIDLSSYKSFCKSFIDKIGRQEEAAIAISQAIFRCKTDERRRGGRLRGDIWLNFHGPDKMGKKRVAEALSELLHGSKDNLICIDLSYQDGVVRPSTICTQQEVTEKNVQVRGKLHADFIAEELGKRRYSVVFLENVNEADFIIQNSLSQAIHTGKFPDSHGREFSINNAIFILTWNRTIAKDLSRRKDCSSFCEETILTAQCWQMKIYSEAYQETTRRSSKSTIQKPTTSQVYLQLSSSSKRKASLSDDDCDRHFGKSMSGKRAHTMPKGFLDLNLPVEEIATDAADDDYDSSSHKENSVSDNSELWIKEFCNQVDATIDFRPFDFDALANDILKDINRIFQSAVGSDSLLEIDPKVMEELLAVAWSLGDQRPLDNWLEQVLGRSFREMKYKISQSSNNIIKLVCEDALVEEHAPRVILPSRIILSDNLLSSVKK
ncbi:protein DWARF 53-LIKE-like isoform X2 [Curcuma longa]|uniref:protein DWARF 53-LIKE-like isoform X2 n=1 Tax=Curcuma longa TaxID=136217 RepID=UPI003D9E6B5D